MGLKIAPASLHWSQPSVPQSPPSSSQTLASAISSPSSRRRSFNCGDGALFCRFVERSALTRSSGNKRSRVRINRKALSGSSDSFSDEEFSKLNEDGDHRNPKMDETAETRSNNAASPSNHDAKFLENLRPFDAFDAFEPPDFPDRDEVIPGNIERKANSADIPLSLRIIKRKIQWQSGIVEAGESAYCSMKKAFSSMVFIIRELHSYTLHIRSILFFEDLQGILANVQKEIHASFVWLFQTVFSQTPTLMVYVMILLANYSVYSMSCNAALAAAPPLQSYAATTEEVSVVDDESFSRSTLKLPSSGGKTASVGGNNGGGGGKTPSVASGTEGDGTFDESNYYTSIGPDGVSSLLNPSSTSGEEPVLSQAAMEQEAALWDSIVEEAYQMRAASTDEALDQETMKNFVSPVDAKIEADDRAVHFKTELLYRVGLAREPNNPLLLANYAQFLYLVIKDLDRAEDYFKKATKVEPKDAEALSKYAKFLWLVRKDLWAAEENYLEAIDAEPTSSFYAANYAHFLWNTGGEDTCYPLSSLDDETTGENGDQNHNHNHSL